MIIHPTKEFKLGKIAKGKLVRINEDAAFTTENGGKLRHPRDNWDTDERRVLRGSYTLSEKQVQSPEQ